MLATANPAVNGAELIDRLAKTGTGADKLELPRLYLASVKRKENRIATADEVIDVMEKAGNHHSCMAYPPTPELTLEKARQIAASGKYVATAGDEAVPVEQLLLAGTELPPEEEPDPVGEALDEFDPAREMEVKEELPVALTKFKPTPKAPKSKGRTHAKAHRPKPQKGFLNAPAVSAPVTTEPAPVA